MKRHCTTCKYASWFSATAGECKYTVTLPNSYLAFGSRMPRKTQINVYTKAECDCWRAKE